MWQELDYRIYICRVTKGGHIEHLKGRTETWSVPPSVMLPFGVTISNQVPAWHVCDRNLITGLTSAASPRVHLSSTCKLGQKLGVSLPLLTCPPSAWSSRLLYRRGRKSRRDLWITLYMKYLWNARTTHQSRTVAHFPLLLSRIIKLTGKLNWTWILCDILYICSKDFLFRIFSDLHSVCEKRRVWEFTASAIVQWIWWNFEEHR
jgi:hypothetical protein